MLVWVTSVGRSPFAVVNPLWAAAKQEDYIPGRIYLLKNRAVEDCGNVAKVIKLLKKLVLEFADREAEIKEIYAEETDFQNFMKTIGGILREEKGLGNEVAVDMTPGRKFMSAIAMYSGVGDRVKNRADRVYYLHLDNNIYQNRPYMLIPMVKQKLYDMKKSLKGLK